MLYFTIQNRLQDGTRKVSEAAGARWQFYPRIVGLSSDILESSFYWRKHFREFPMKSWASRFRGRRSIWWGWRVALVAPRSRNDVSYVTQIIDDIHFAWQAQYLVRLEGDFTCSTHWKWRFICAADHWWHSFCVAGAVCGEVGGWLFVAGAALRVILGDSRSAKCCMLQYKIVSKMGRGRSPKRRVRDDDFIIPRISSDYRRISSDRLSIGGSTSGTFTWDLELKDFVAGAVFGEFAQWLCLLCALEMTFHVWRRSLMTFILRGRCNIWWGSRLTLLSPRIVNDASNVTRINHEIHFTWQVQYLVRFQVDFACCAHWKWWFICDADHWWHWFCVAGAVFGEVARWLCLLCALEMTFHLWCRSLMTLILRGRRSIWWSWRVTLLAPRIGNDVSYVTKITDDIHFVWQAQYLVKLEAASCCSAHCKWRFKVVPE